MTTFRIREYTRPDGKKHYRVQQWRWQPIPYWSSSYYYTGGGANYGCVASTREEAELLLAEFIADTREKILRRPWNFIRTTVTTKSV
jgi:hypothetical protein